LTKRSTMRGLSGPHSKPPDGQTELPRPLAVNHSSPSKVPKHSLNLDAMASGQNLPGLPASREGLRLLVTERRQQRVSKLRSSS
jgi:hypothetical protein